MMQYEDFLTLCQKRKSIRQFSSKPIDPVMLEKILAAAKTAPYASGRTNWEIITVTEKEVITALAEAVDRYIQNLPVKGDFRESFITYAQNFSAFKTAPVLIIPAFRISQGISGMFEAATPEQLQWERDALVKSISCVCMLILLAAESLGLGACYMTGPLIAQQELKKRLPIKPGRELGAIIPVGYHSN